MPKPDWEVFERRSNELLGLDATAASGATWKDKGDGTTRETYTEVWPLMADAKTTVKASYSLKAKFLADMKKLALQDGKTFALPLKFTQEEKLSEWVVVPLEDYAFLVEEHRKKLGEFTEEERGLIRAVAKQLKGELLSEKVLRILAKMGDQ